MTEITQINDDVEWMASRFIKFFSRLRLFYLMMYCTTACWINLSIAFAHLIGVSFQAKTIHTDDSSVVKGGNAFVSKSSASHSMPKKDLGKLYSKPGQEIRNRIGRGSRAAKNDLLPARPAKPPLNKVSDFHPLLQPALSVMLRNVEKKFD